MNDSAETDRTAPTRRRRGRRRRGLRALAVLGAAVLGFVLTLGYLALSGVPLAAPDWVTRGVETRLNKGLGNGGRVSVGAIELAVDRLVPRLRLRDVGVFDARGVEVARLNEVGARLAAPALLQGNVEMNALRISGAQITVRRRADGTIDLSFGAGVGATGTLASVLDGIEQSFSRAPLSQLQRIVATSLTITLEDARSGRLWQVTEGRIELIHAADSIGLTVTADVFNGTEELATTVLEFRTDKGSARASLNAVFENAAAADIAAQSPALAFLEVLDAPISGTLDAEIGLDGEVSGLAGTLSVGAGVLQPTPATKPIPIVGASARVSYDAATQRLGFEALSLETDAARGRATGQAFLQEFRGGWPETLVAQFQLADVSLQPEGVFTEPMEFDTGAVEFRLRLDPFSVELGQLSLVEGARRSLTNGTVRGTADGWDVSLNMTMNKAPLDRLLAIWPVPVAAKARDWLDSNVIAGTITDLAGAFRLSPEIPKGLLSVSFSFAGGEVKPLKWMAPVTGAAGYASLSEQAFTVVLEAGRIEAPQGGAIDVAGSYLKIPDVTQRPGVAEVTVKSDSAITAVLALLDQPPVELMRKADRPVDLVAGRAELVSNFRFSMAPGLQFDEVDYNVAGRLVDVFSDKLVPRREVRSEALEIRATPSGVAISGRGDLGAVPVHVVWSQSFGPDAGGRSVVEGTVGLNQAFLTEFGIGLPPGSLDGEGIGSVTVDLARDAPPEFRLVSDLNRMGLRLAALGWSKARNQTGRLEVAGRLGPKPSIDRIVLQAPGLSVSGVIDLSDSGAMARADFDRVRVGGWLDGPVTLIGRGAGQPPAVIVNGGEVDLRAANFGRDGGSGTGGGPITLRLQRLVITEGIAFTDFTGEFDSRGGLDGNFSARINGRTQVKGAVVPTRTGTAVRLTSQNAGGALAASGILSNARGGTLDLTLAPTEREGVYNGKLAIRDTRIVQAPAMTELLAAISIIGLIEQMNTGGITMSEVDALFQLSPSQLKLFRFSGVGPSLGISLDGIYDLRSERVDMQGVVSPVYFLNGIGAVFSRPGEGLFGFNFNLRGRADNPSVTVNPLSLLTPGMFREIFRRPPPAPGQ